MIFCDSHPEQVASKFCRKHQSLICKDCLIENHLDHSQDCKAVVNENITDFLSRHQNIMMTLNAKIIELSEDITNFNGHDKQLTSSHFLKFISILRKFDIFTQHLEEVEEVK